MVLLKLLQLYVYLIIFKINKKTDNAFVLYNKIF